MLHFKRLMLPSPLPEGEGADRVVLPLYIDLKLRVELEF